MRRCTAIYNAQPGNRKIIGTVGELQFEVIQYRLEQEYGASCSFLSRNFYKACWITNYQMKFSIEDFIKRKTSNIAHDKDKNPKVFLAPSPFLLTQAESDYPRNNFSQDIKNLNWMNNQINSFNIKVYGLILESGLILLSKELIMGEKVFKFPGGGLEYGEGLIDGLKESLKKKWVKEFIM